MFYVRTLLAAIVAGAVVASPSTLMKRSQKLTMSYCKDCIPINDPDSVCVNTTYKFYIHWGDNNLKSWHFEPPFLVLPTSDHTLLITSKGSSFLYDSGSCSTESGTTIPTPSGSGTCSTSNCGGATNQVLGTISAGGNAYTCYRANNQNYQNDCLGVT